MESTKGTETVETTSKEEEDAAEDEANSEDEENSEYEPATKPQLRSLNRKPRAAGDPYQKLCGQRVGILVDVSGSTVNFVSQYQDALRAVRDNLAGTGSEVGIRPFATNSPALPGRGFTPRELDDAGVKELNTFIDNLGKEWPQSNELLSSNYSIALQSALGRGYDEIIVIGDGFIENGGLVPGRSGTYSGRVFDSFNYADQLRQEGTRVVALKMGDVDTSNGNVYWSDSTYRLNNYFPDSQTPPPGFERGEDGAVEKKNGRQLTTVKWRTVEGEVGSRTAYGDGRRSDLFVRWKFTSPEKYLGRVADRVVNSDYNQLAADLGELTSGCVGTIKIHKKIVDANGKVDNKADTGGFTFQADRALVNDREQRNVRQSTGNDGVTTFNYPVAKNGTATITIQEILDQSSAYKLRPQDVAGNKKTVATCKVLNAGDDINVSYGSGSGRVVKSDVSKNSFSISGLKEKDIVDCTVHNTAGEPELSIAKSASTEPRVITNDGQEFQATYQVDVKNSGTAEGTPESIRELPAAPQGLRILRVEVENPENEDNSLIKKPIQLNKDGSAWVLPKSAMKPVPAKQTRSAKVNVIYRVEKMADLQGNLECPDGGLTNRVELDGDNNAEACVGLSIPSVGVVKFINGEDADTREEAATTTGGGDTTITYDIRNDGTAPLEKFTITDERLDPDTGNPAGAIVPEGLTCNRDSRVEKQGDTITVIPNEPLANGPVITCTWTSANLAAEPGEYHANRVTVSANAAAPGDQKLEEGDIAPVSATDDAWLFTLPVLTGNMPLTGGKGVWPFLLAGLALALGGAFALRRKTA
ncbi:LPXTG cell wall anchor domain-containing protein [Corynebacterium sp. TAE3-ERU2]|uniref:LPXTG cell wall anchor domain-containing protein n=1 Tax=Corynebacterium sp. TAE3-ERU2 TaxID=2849497 RepID=UPI001C45440C|nr:LPXTG cell wall anchor domain-containing protein [Corynebacterium sp. TAE3-ERU2]MBV7302058.1 LPXTG cell wall anchor domain-containing protein [Corynebacterium sp. TAE3-ERU2]